LFFTQIFYDFFFFTLFNFKGSRSYQTGEMNGAQFGAIVGQVNLAHQPPMVSTQTHKVKPFYDFLLFTNYALQLCFKSFEI
jgi:hypothetical protein